MITFLIVPLVFVAVFVGVVMGAWLCREDLRIAQRGVEEARAALVSAGMGHLIPGGSAPSSATPPHSEGR